MSDTNDRVTSSTGIVRRQVQQCEDCAEFRIEKSYSGSPGTTGEEEYERISPPDACPACGGQLEVFDL